MSTAMTGARRKKLRDRVQVLSSDSIGILFPLHDPPPSKRDENWRALNRLSGHLGEALAIAEECLGMRGLK